MKKECSSSEDSQEILVLADALKKNQLEEHYGVTYFGQFWGSIWYVS